MIEFGGIPLKATQSRVKIDLTIEYVEYIDYKFQRYKVDEIVSRARNCLKNVFDQDYSVVFNNCEHLARWCVSGEHMSLQVDEKVELSIDHLQNVVNRLLRYVASASNSDRIIIDVASTSVILILSNECAYSLLRQSQFERDLKNGFICTRCQTFNKARVANKGLLAAGAYLLLKTFSKCETVSLIMKRSDLFWCIVSTIGLGLTYIGSEQNPFGDRYVSQIRITRKNQLPIGSILAHPNFSQVIVKNVIYKSASSAYSQMQIVHYPYRGIWGRRVVSEETFSFNLADDWLQVLEFPKETVYKRKDVVHKAKLKLGEKKFNMFTNRSSHMAWSCKVHNKDNQNRKPKRKYVKQNGDVKAGDLVNFKYCGLPHQGIVTSKNRKAEILNIEFIYVSKIGVVEECSSEIDMGKTNILLCNFRDLKIHTNAQILENAQSKLGQKLSRVQFLKECILR